MAFNMIIAILIVSVVTEAFLCLTLFIGETNQNTLVSIFPPSYAHLQHLPHYNSGGSRYTWGNYSSFMALEPEYGVAKQRPTAIEFSIQDRNNNDVHNITTMVEIYKTDTGKRIHVFPWTYHSIGDFILFYIFPQTGAYQIVVSVLNDDYKGGLSNLIGYADPPRTLLSNIKGCNCERTIFNISISPSYGLIQNIMYGVIIILPLSVLGSVLVWKFKASRYNIKNSISTRVISKREAVRYLVMLVAMGGGIVHLAVFQDHATVHVYYSIFLLAAAASQVAYGIVFVLVTLSRDAGSQQLENKNENRFTIQKAVHDYKRKMTINLFGLFGTCVLIGLYTYSIILPPPLSPTNTAEQVDIEGISAKLLEIFLVIGIIMIIKWDREEIKNKLIQIKDTSRIHD
jgi:hypothetical protein